MKDDEMRAYSLLFGTLNLHGSRVRPHFHRRSGYLWPQPRTVIVAQIHLSSLSLALLPLFIQQSLFEGGYNLFR